MAENLLRVLSENQTVNAKVNSILIILMQLLPYSVNKLHVSKIFSFLFILF